MARMRSTFKSSKAFNIVLAAVLAVALLVPAVAYAGAPAVHVQQWVESVAQFSSVDSATGIATEAYVFGSDGSTRGPATDFPGRTVQAAVVVYQSRLDPAPGEWMWRIGFAEGDQATVTRNLTSAHVVLSGELEWIEWGEWGESGPTYSTSPFSADMTWNGIGDLYKDGYKAIDHPGRGYSGYKDFSGYDDVYQYVFNVKWVQSWRDAAVEGVCLVDGTDFAASATSAEAYLSAYRARDVVVEVGK